VPDLAREVLVEKMGMFVLGCRGNGDPLLIGNTAWYYGKGLTVEGLRDPLDEGPKEASSVLNVTLAGPGVKQN